MSNRVPTPKAEANAKRYAESYINAKGQARSASLTARPGGRNSAAERHLTESRRHMDKLVALIGPQEAMKLVNQMECAGLTGAPIARNRFSR